MKARTGGCCVRPVLLLSTALCTVLGTLPALASAQGGRPQWDGVPGVRVADLTLVHTAHVPNVLVRVVARGLSDASSLAFLPNGDILVTEKEGRLRVIRDGILDPTPVTGTPAVRHGAYSCTRTSSGTGSST